MGTTWMDLVRVGPDTYSAEEKKVRTVDDREELEKRYVVDEHEANALACAAVIVGRTGRQHFPLLTMFRDWDDDDYRWLGPDEVLELLKQLQRLRRVTRREEYIHGLDGGEILTRWQEHTYVRNYDEWGKYLDGIEQFLERAGLENMWVRFWYD